MKIAIVGFSGCGKSMCFKTIANKKTDGHSPTKPYLTKVILRIAISLLLIFSLAGCGGRSSVEEILEKDPSFQKDLDTQKRIKTLISELEKEYGSEKDLAKQEIRAIEKELEEKRQALNSKIISLKKDLHPKIEFLRTRLQETNSIYKQKLATFKDSQKRLKNIKKLLAKKSDLTLSADETSIWNKRAGKLEKEIASLRQDIDNLRGDTRILQAEIGLLKD